MLAPKYARCQADETSIDQYLSLNEHDRFKTPFTLSLGYMTLVKLAAQNVAITFLVIACLASQGWVSLAKKSHHTKNDEFVITKWPDKTPEEATTDACGTCYGVCNAEQKRCDCPRGYRGPDCSQGPRSVTKMCKSYQFYREGNCSFHAPMNYCLNQCNKRGKCVAGWCYCDPGYYGYDCSLSTGEDGKPELLAGLGYRTRKRRPWIYVYELPPEYNAWLNIRNSDRPLAFMFQQRLLSTGARIADGDKADYFFIPMNVRGPTDSLHMAKAIEYIRQTWPYWDRHGGGHRHIILHPGDTGRTEVVKKPTRDLTENCTYLTHWGLYEDYPFSNWKAAHRPGKDIVVPILIGSNNPRSHAFKRSPLHPLHPSRSPDGPAVKRDLQMLFAGRICGGREAPNSTKWPNCRPINVGYSQGVRQLVHYHYWNRTGYAIAVHNPNYLADLARTRFCLAPTGGGHGHRQILVAFSGCVPLLIGDYVYQPFEPELDWSAFSVSLPQKDIPRLHEVLEGIDDEQYSRMQVALRCGAEHMTFSGFIGGFKWDVAKYDAFETIMEILRSRLDHPGVAPEKLREVDPQLAAFMECRDPDKEQAEEPSSAPEGLCSLSELDGMPPTCERCTLDNHGVIPGGAPCCGAPSLAECHRAWE